MGYNVKTIHVFERQAKKLVKKYVSLKKELLGLVETLKSNPVQGVSLGNNCYKIRIAISSKGKGRSGGARVITHVIVKDEVVYLLSIYDKSDKDTITNDELAELLKYIP